MVSLFDPVSGRRPETRPYAPADAIGKPGQRILGIVGQPLSVPRERCSFFVVTQSVPARVSAEERDVSAAVEPRLHPCALLARPIFIVTEGAEHSVAIKLDVAAV